MILISSHAAFGLTLSENAAAANAAKQTDIATTPLVYSFGTIMAFSLIKSGICKSAVTPMRYKANDFCSLSDPDINMK